MFNLGVNNNRTQFGEGGFSRIALVMRLYSLLRTPALPELQSLKDHYSI